MDGENNGKPYEQMDDLGVPLFSETSIWLISLLRIGLWDPFQINGRTSWLINGGDPNHLLEVIKFGHLEREKKNRSTPP